MNVVKAIAERGKGQAIRRDVPSMTQYTSNDPSGNPIPEALRREDAWVFWEWVEREEGPTKVPFNPNTGEKAKPTDPNTWGSFEQAELANSEHSGAGIGFMLDLDSPFAGVDLDDCIDESGELYPEAQEIVDQFASYTEVSPSGKGVKVFIQGSKPGPRSRTRAAWGGDIELYDSSRFFTVTGKHLGGTPVKVCGRQRDFRELYESLFCSGPKPTPSQATGGGTSVLSDDEVIERARQSNADPFIPLFDQGDTSVKGDDDSAADDSLAWYLAFWTNHDREQMTRLMMRSTLYRDKFDRHDYLPRTIEHACSMQPEGYGRNSVITDPSLSIAGRDDGLEDHSIIDRSGGY